ncbi:MAG: hypothetical protein HYT93_00585 [Parcubacteria group bacterium]|nr:hypothetical protein [Parcubacteria group bacterium]
MKIRASSLHTHEGFILESEDLREAEKLKILASFFRNYRASTDAGPDNKSSGIRKILTEEDGSKNSKPSLHIIKVTTPKKTKNPHPLDTR